MGKKDKERAGAPPQKAAEDSEYEESLVLVSSRTSHAHAGKAPSRFQQPVKDISAAGSIGGSLEGSARKPRRGSGGHADSSRGSSFAASESASTTGSARKRKPSASGVDIQVLGKRLQQVAEEADDTNTNSGFGDMDLSETEEEGASPPKRGQGTATGSIRKLGYGLASSDEEPEDEDEGNDGAARPHQIQGATRQVYHCVRAMPWVSSSAMHAMHSIVCMNSCIASTIWCITSSI